jgi:hypothetical protein
MDSRDIMYEEQKPTYILVKERYGIGQDNISSIAVIEGDTDETPEKTVEDKYQDYFGPGTEMEYEDGGITYWREDRGIVLEIEEFHLLGPAEYAVLDRLGLTEL